MKQTTSVNVSQRKQTMCGISQRCWHWKELWTSNNNKPIHRLQTRSPVQKSNNGSWTSKHVKETLGWQQTNVPTKTSQTCPLSTVPHRSLMWNHMTILVSDQHNSTRDRLWHQPKMELSVVGGPSQPSSQASWRQWKHALLTARKLLTQETCTW